MKTQESPMLLKASCGGHNVRSFMAIQGKITIVDLLVALKVRRSTKVDSIQPLGP